MRPPTLTEFALSEVRKAQNALGAAELVFDVLLESAAQGQVNPAPERIAVRAAALRLAPTDGRTARGEIAELLAAGPRSHEDLAIVNCFFALGAIARLQSLPRENRRGFARDLVLRSDALLARTAYTPYEYLPLVAPQALGVAIWDALVVSLIDEVNLRGGEPGAAALIRAESLRYLPPEVRRAYLRRILSDIHEPDAALRYAGLLVALDEAPPPPPAPAGPELLPPAAPAPALPPPRPLAVTPWAARPQAHEPMATVEGSLAAGPAGLVLRALMLLSGVLLLGHLGALLARALGVRRATTLVLSEGELVVEQRLSLWGRTLWQRQRAYATPAVARVARDVPYGRLYLLLGLSVLTLLAALALPILPSDGEILRYALLAACGAVLAGIALDLTDFLASYLQRGHCNVTVAVRGGDTYRLTGVPAPAVARFAEAARRAASVSRPPAAT